MKTFFDKILLLVAVSVAFAAGVYTTTRFQPPPAGLIDVADAQKRMDSVEANFVKFVQQYNGMVKFQAEAGSIMQSRLLVMERALKSVHGPNFELKLKDARAALEKEYRIAHQVAADAPDTPAVAVDMIKHPRVKPQHGTKGESNEEMESFY
jgi:hypothetical protein